ncbi:hypothetical protein CTI12_AA134490 [Artemisia annua]|uniref:SANT domain-containing protein n=1 Tax=Artemisia annua TaxID=35608 RepID=A0A2U1PN05_ARTAN|nr:hypothetical protein CTI12_AA134490 [Artemisia annua]
MWIHHKPQNMITDLGYMKNENVISLVPGRALESWNELEKESFLLGLYIFEKNFARLRRFIESKKVGEILAYYYGIFYKSDEYIRWSDCRKSRGKKCKLGPRLFSGLRLQEFIARLVPHVSEECKNSLMEVSRSFGDDKIELEEYVSSIKTLIGIKTFIDTVAIGKGKQDLTGNAIEPTKQNQAIHIRPEIPIGKACSTLTAAEIIQFLTGDYRLSKARSNDLFWEAVWPRLLARGWHSEEPNGYNFTANGKHSLVFLMPGVETFSRELIKWEEYLDSVTDVLSKVALNPQLLELDNEEKVEKVTNFEKKEENGFLEKRKNRYLQPRIQNRGNKVVVKFTVVDTSLCGGKIVEMREMEIVKLVSDDVSSELDSSDESDSGDTRLSACTRFDSKAGSSLDSNVGSSSQANPKLSSNLSFTSRCSSIDTVEEQQMNLFDLNFPHVTTEFGHGESATEVKVERNEMGPEKPKEQENGSVGSRRQGTRNRPPTAKALEAIANGLLMTHSKKKGKEDNVPRPRKTTYSRDEAGGAVSECSAGDASSVVKGDDEDGEIEKWSRML